MGMPIYRPRELRRCSVAQSTMRTYPIVIVSPSFCHGPCFIERQEPMLVQALDTKLTIERLDERIICGLSSLYGHVLQDSHDIVPGQPLARLDWQALTALVVD